MSRFVVGYVLNESDPFGAHIIRLAFRFLWAMSEHNALTQARQIALVCLLAEIEFIDPLSFGRKVKMLTLRTLHRTTSTLLHSFFSNFSIVGQSAGIGVL